MISPAKQQILLVDDEPQILIALEDILSDQFTVFSAQSGQDALRVMEQEDNIAVVITDQRMPQMQGDELVSRLQAIHAAQRIMVTGYADLGAVVRAVNDGQIFAYVTKPWDAEDLRLKVAKAATQFRLSRELATEKQLLDDLMNNSPDGIYFKDRELRFIRANKTVAGWLGHEVSALVGKKLTDVMASTEEAQRIEADELESLRSNTAILDSVRQESHSSVTRWFSETKAPVSGVDGDTAGLIGISRDITRQRELEQQLLQSQKMEAMGQLAGGVAHDFNNLLVVIQGYGELLRDGFQAADLRRDQVEQLLKATERAAALTKQLLAFSRKGPARASLLDLNELVTEVVQMLERLLPAGVNLVVDLMAQSEVVRADPTQLEQVLLNLVINARDAMPAGGQVQIRTESALPSSAASVGPSRCARLIVSDTGTGMPPEVRARIFEPFFSTKEVGKGTGLGLATVYGIVRQLGGTILVESEVGIGTRFVVEIPCSDVRDSAAPPKREATRRRRGSETVLIVEDDEAVRRIAERILESAGYTVLSAASPGEAQHLCRETDTKIDLLLTDVSMPEMEGPSLAALLVQSRPELRVLYMSGYVAESNAEEFGKEGTHYIEKPFGPERLLSVVQGVLAAD